MKSNKFKNLRNLEKIVGQTRYASLSGQDNHVSFGLIGCGNLGKNIMSNALKTNKNVSFRVSVKDQHEFDKIWNDFEDYRDRIQCYKWLDYDKIVNFTSSTILAVKASDALTVSKMLKSYNVTDKTIISTIPTITHDQLVALFDTQKITRIMPSFSNPGINNILPIYQRYVNENIYAKNFILVDKLFRGWRIKPFEDEEKFQLTTIYSASLPALYLSVKKDVIIQAINAGFTTDEAEMLVDNAFNNAEDLNLVFSKDYVCNSIATPEGVTASGLMGYLKTGSVGKYFGFAEAKLKEAAKEFRRKMSKTK